VQAKRYYRYASIRDDILRKRRLETPPNVTLPRLPAIPQLQSIIDEMCRQRGASCAGALADDSAGGGASTTRPSDDSSQTDDYDDDVRATTIKILLFPIARNRSTLMHRSRTYLREGYKGIYTSKIVMYCTPQRDRTSSDRLLHDSRIRQLADCQLADWMDI